MNFETWDEVITYFRAECEDIARGCEEEGYPAHGVIYDLRCESLYRDLYEAFGHLAEV